MKKFVRTVDRISDACAVIAAVMLAVATLVITWMVLYRALGNSTYWETELAIYLIISAVMVGSPYCLKTRGHIGVDLISEFLSRKHRAVLAKVIALVGLAVCLYLAWKGLGLTVEAFEKNERSGSMWNPPRWPLFLMMPVGLGLTALQYVAEWFRPAGEIVRPGPISGQGA
jgi:TRAP-type C4-dicarboxylate transport system permease small subunit